MEGLMRSLLLAIMVLASVVVQAPEGHYFVMGEQRGSRDVSGYFGQHPAERLEQVR
jgi:hypothetical protein